MSLKTIHEYQLLAAKYINNKLTTVHPFIQSSIPPTFQLSLCLAEPADTHMNEIKSRFQQAQFSSFQSLSRVQLFATP